MEIRSLTIRLWSDKDNFPAVDEFVMVSLGAIMAHGTVTGRNVWRASEFMDPSGGYGCDIRVEAKKEGA